ALMADCALGPVRICDESGPGTQRADANDGEKPGAHGRRGARPRCGLDAVRVAGRGAVLGRSLPSTTPATLDPAAAAAESVRRLFPATAAVLGTAAAAAPGGTAAADPGANGRFFQGPAAAQARYPAEHQCGRAGRCHGGLARARARGSL